MFRRAKSRVAAVALGSAPLPQPGVSGAGSVCGLRVSLDGRDCAIASAMLALHARGNDVLWSLPAVP
jgi:hypothetical protein